ncbi:hypothetical protein HDU83_008605 [Entophlyctis luteolus]|nr:hypothetical protein HDU83_008605 [Entophlyctis luteolus]
MKAPVRVSYDSAQVQIPPDFLRRTPTDARPITYNAIDFSRTALPEYDGLYAVVLDHVLSRLECEQLLQLAEASVLGDGPRWKPALVNVGGGYEMLDSDYRNSERIIWDSQDVMDRVWARVQKQPEIVEELAIINERDLLGPFDKVSRKEYPDWRFHGINERMRFLKYTPGQFFRPHCDGAYSTTKAGKIIRTHFTVLLYLNDSAEEFDGSALQGGTTFFLSSDDRRHVAIRPKAGRMLIFQHRGLRHCGDDVVAGVKYIVRSDLMYELQR